VMNPAVNKTTTMNPMLTTIKQEQEPLPPYLQDIQTGSQFSGQFLQETTQNGVQNGLLSTQFITESSQMPTQAKMEITQNDNSFSPLQYTPNASPQINADINSIFRSSEQIQFLSSNSPSSNLGADSVQSNQSQNVQSTLSHNIQSNISQNAQSNFSQNIQSNISHNIQSSISQNIQSHNIQSNLSQNIQSSLPQSNLSHLFLPNKFEEDEEMDTSGLGRNRSSSMCSMTSGYESSSSPVDHRRTTSSPVTGRSIGGGGRTNIQLWQFLKELLIKKDQFSNIIRWTDEGEGIFKIEDSTRVAQLWGERKNRPNMNYDKMSRSMRQYYRKGIMKKTARSQRLIYQFCAGFRN